MRAAWRGGWRRFKRGWDAAQGQMGCGSKNGWDAAPKRDWGAAPKRDWGAAPKRGWGAAHGMRLHLGWDAAPKGTGVRLMGQRGGGDGCSRVQGAGTRLESCGGGARARVCEPHQRQTPRHVADGGADGG
eukprot:scaffold6699_cov55-Isochrysis_galbana.AAC.1